MTKQDASQHLQYERSPDYRRLFSNHFYFRFSPGDGNITFSQITETSGLPLQTVILEQVNVNMSWPQLKLLGEYISAAVQEMEREAGPIVSIGLPKEELQKQSVEIIKGFMMRKK